MSETPTRRAILEAGVFAAVSWLAIDGSVAQAPLPPPTTQLYFPGESQNRSDGLFRSELRVRTAKNAGWLAGRFDFVLD